MNKNNLKKTILSNIPFDGRGRINPKSFCERFGLHEGLAILKFITSGFKDENANSVIDARLADEGLKYQKSDIPFEQWPEKIQRLYPGLYGKDKLQRFSIPYPLMGTVVPKLTDKPIEIAQDKPTATNISTEGNKPGQVSACNVEKEIVSDIIADDLFRSDSRGEIQEPDREFDLPGRIRRRLGV